MEHEKRTIKVKFEGFWPDFEPDQLLMVQILKKHYELILSDKPDYLICSVIPPFYQYMQYDCIRIMYSGENMIPDLNTVDYALSSYPVQLYDRCFHIPVGFRRTFRLQHLLERCRGEIVFSHKYLEQKTVFANFCASHDSADGKRLAFFKQLSEYKTVDSIGTLANNTGVYVQMLDGSKWDYQRKSKFTLCFESVSQEGFNTEKLVDAFYTDTIPVYYGDPKIGDVFNSKAFINVAEYESFDDAIQWIIELDNNEDLYLEMLNQPPLVDPEYVESFEKRLEDFLLNIFEQPIDKAFRRARSFIPLSYEKHVLRGLKIYNNKFIVCFRHVCSSIMHFRMRRKQRKQQR